jgi:hypothetical protein
MRTKGMVVVDEDDAAAAELILKSNGDLQWMSKRRLALYHVKEVDEVILPTLGSRKKPCIYSLYGCDENYMNRSLFKLDYNSNRPG